MKNKHKARIWDLIEEIMFSGGTVELSPEEITVIHPNIGHMHMSYETQVSESLVEALLQIAKNEDPTPGAGC